MSNEENVVEMEEQEKRPFNIYRILLISIISLVLSFVLIVIIYNSDWYTNKIMLIKQSKNSQLSKVLKYSYLNKYERGQLKVNLTLSNVDDEIMNIFRGQLGEDAWLIRLYFLDEENYKLAELNFPIGDFMHADKGVYSAQGVLTIDKKTIRKIKSVQPMYREFLNFTYKDFIKYTVEKYQEAMNNLLDF